MLMPKIAQISTKFFVQPLYTQTQTFHINFQGISKIYIFHYALLCKQVSFFIFFLPPDQGLLKDPMSSGSQILGVQIQYLLYSYILLHIVPVVIQKGSKINYKQISLVFTHQLSSKRKIFYIFRRVPFNWEIITCSYISSLMGIDWEGHLSFRGIFFRP